MGGWWRDDVLDAGKLPLMLCFIAFVVTFVVTRTITRLIRAGRGPFRDRVTGSGLHVHHAVPGLILLIVGAFVAVAPSDGQTWRSVAAVLVGVGVSLVLDEFALILHLTDVYWSDEGRLSVDLVALAGACLGLALVGFSPIGVRGVGTTELEVRLGSTAVLVIHLLVILTCVLKGKYTLTLFGLFIPLIALGGALRLARPGSVWARRRYPPSRQAKAERRAQDMDRRFDPVLHRVQDFVAGRPSDPDPARATRPAAAFATPSAATASQPSAATASKPSAAGAPEQAPPQ